MKAGRQYPARSVIPAVILQAGRIRAARAMHAQFAIAAIILEQRFEQLRPPWPAEKGRRGPGKGFRNRRVGITDHTRIAKHPPCQRNCSGVRQRPQQRLHRPVAHMDIHKFVDIAKQHPIGGTHQRVFVGGL